jgi:hypothetical protein
MNIKHIFHLAALAVMTVACSSEDLTQQPASQSGQTLPFRATISAYAGTRGLTEATDGLSITAKWVAGEKIALVHGATVDVMEVKTVDNDGNATVDGELNNYKKDEAVYLVYVGSNATSMSNFKKDLEGIYKSMHESDASITAITTDMIKETFIIVNQKGTLTAISEDIDYRLGSSTLTKTELISGEKYVTFGGTEPPKLYSQFAIWKLTLKDGSGAALPATQLDVMEVGNGNEGIASVTIDASTVAANPGVVYVMLPAPVPPVVNVEATVGTVTYRVILSGVTLEVGKFYRSTLTVSKLAGSISYAETNVQKNFGDGAFIHPLTNTGDGVVTYESTNTAVAEVDENGSVTINGIGSTTIKATVADSNDYTYATNTAEYTLTVKYSGTGNLAPMDNPENL